MIDPNNAMSFHRQPLSPRKSYGIGGVYKAGESSQRNFYQKSKNRSPVRQKATCGPAVVVHLSQNHDHTRLTKKVLCYNERAQLEYYTEME